MVEICSCLGLARVCCCRWIVWVLFVSTGLLFVVVVVDCWGVVCC